MYYLFICEFQTLILTTSKMLKTKLKGVYTTLVYMKTHIQCVFLKWILKDVDVHSYFLLFFCLFFVHSLFLMNTQEQLTKWSNIGGDNHNYRNFCTYAWHTYCAHLMFICLQIVIHFLVQRLKSSPLHLEKKNCQWFERDYHCNIDTLRPTETKWPIFCTRYFQNAFASMKQLNFIEVDSYGLD